ncbi:hypothetical protein [Nocardioides litoris]|uniref:divisome protein SepX/GlpR n=1 Tax=Nocardioides litoris TaxID=1926648 RepID=UPI0011221BF8|nr:hypothetical protein [Nocardioides litoris]
MDLSALIFVALAVAWAAYLIPKALRHHEDGAASRAVDGFSHRLRVLARREPVDSRSARLVVQPGKPASTAVPVDGPVGDPVGDPVGERAPQVRVDRRPLAVRRAAARQAARRRLRVLLVLVVALAGVALAAGLGALGWGWVALPGALLVGWLVACRLMVRRERAVPASRLPVPAAPVAPAAPATVDEEPETDQIEAVPAEVDAEVAEEPTAEPDPEPAAEPAEPAGWDPRQVPLPTYVAKEPAARRSVRTIDLDSTGVWTSGRSEADSALAREAEAERKRQQEQTAASSVSEAERRRRAAGS